MIRNVVRRLTDHYRDAKAELQQVARSKARMLKGLKEILGLDAFKAQRTRVPQPTGVNVAMMDGSPRTYYTDGSLRHTLGHDRRSKRARVRARRAKAVTA